jgi:hypothetical protein
MRLNKRQDDVARIAGIGRWKVYRIEAAELDSLRLGDIRKSFEALGVRFDASAFYRGAELERILDDVHARLIAAALRVLSENGWESHVEVTFQVRGDRGSIDILAWHLPTRALLVIEVKSELPGIDLVLRPLDIKVRRAPALAWERFRWKPASVSRVLVLPEDSTARRLVSRHAAVLDLAFPTKGRAIRHWVRHPDGAISGLWFLSLARSASGVRNPSSRKRVLRPRRRAAHAQHGPDRGNLRLIDPHKVGHLSE